MKVMRVLLWCLGLLLAITAIALAVVLNPSVQTWAARRALASGHGFHGTIRRVSAGLGGVEVEQATIESAGAVLTLPAARVDLPLLAAGLRRVSIRSLVAKGWTLDLSRASEVKPVTAHAGVRGTGRVDATGFSLLSTAQAADVAEAARPAVAAFRGLFAAARLPVDLAVDSVDLDGYVLLPPSAGPGASRVHVEIRGGGLAAGREGRFILDALGAKTDGGSVTVHAELRAAMDTPRTFRRFATKLEASAAGTDFPHGVRLVIDAAADRSPSGETYSALVSGADRQLVDLKGELVSATARISGQWRIDVRDADVSPFVFGRRLPAFFARGEGGFETATTLQEVHVSGQLKASAEHLDAVRAELGVVGPLSLAAEFDVLNHGSSIRVERLDATLAAAAPVLTVRALQPFEFNLATAELRVAEPGNDLIGLSVSGVPLTWAQPWLRGLSVVGGDVRGEFAASARDGGLALRSRSPLAMTGLSVAKDGQSLVQHLDVTLDASADYTPRGWQAEIVELQVQSRGQALLKLEGRAGQLAGADRAIKATGKWTADLPGWAAQPALNGQIKLTSGQAQGEFTASLDATRAIETKLTAANLVAVSKEKLPDITAGLRADIGPDGKTTFQASLGLDQAGRKSDLLFAGTLTPLGARTNVDARLTGALVHVDDAKLLGLLVGGGGEPRTDTGAAGPPPTGPFWRNWSGQVALALKKVVYGASFEATDVGGTLRLDPTALNLAGVRASFAPDSEATVSGAVNYEAKNPLPYRLGLDAALNNFDTGPAFRAIDPTKLPTVEGRINLTTHIVGVGGTPGEAAERARGDLQVTGRSGVFRALSADVTGRVQKTQSTVAAIGGILGAVTGKKEYVDYAARTQILTDITKALGEIPFDQLNVTANRDEALNVALKDFTLISPEIRLTGGGGIQYVAGKSLLEQPLNLELQLGARGNFGDLLRRAGLLENQVDNLGYRAFISPIRIGGTLAKTDTSELLKTLLSSALLK